jgi:polyisoprenoid-binding protein YceI
MQTQTPTDMPAKRRRRRWPWFLGGGIVLILLAVTLGPYIYIHFIQSDPPAKFSIDNVGAGATTTAPATGATTTAPATGATGAAGATSAAPASTAAPSGGGASSSEGIDGAWTIASGSQAGYRVKEVLFGQNTDAVGRTSDVTGTMAIAGTTVNSASFKVDLTSVKSDESQRDQQFQGRIMQTSQFPDATFTLTQPVDLGSVPADQAKVSFAATGELTLHGVTKPVQVAVDARRNGGNIEVVGSIPVKFSDYGINNPSTAAVTTQDNGVVEVSLVFTKS